MERQLGRLWSLAALSMVVGGCSLLTDPTGGSSIEISGDRIVIDGVANDPIGEPVVAERLETPLGELVVRTYDSRLGPCYELAFPDGEVEANCIASSGVDPDAPVTGDPGGSIEAINGPSRNVGMMAPDLGVGMLHHGLAHPWVATVTIEPSDEAAHEPIGGFPLVTAPNVPGLVVYVAWSPLGVDEYVLAGYDGDGCLLDADHTSLSGAMDAGPGDAARDCSGELPEVLLPPATTAP